LLSAPPLPAGVKSALTMLPVLVGPLTAVACADLPESAPVLLVPVPVPALVLPRSTRSQNPCRRGQIASTRWGLRSVTCRSTVVDRHRQSNRNTCVGNIR
jgi:hypothetical protein